eukprot:1145898-Pelagomonas_calceolata.AAC.2
MQGFTQALALILSNNATQAPNKRSAGQRHRLDTDHAVAGRSMQKRLSVHHNGMGYMCIMMEQATCASRQNGLHVHHDKRGYKCIMTEKATCVS